MRSIPKGIRSKFSRSWKPNDAANLGVHHNYWWVLIFDFVINWIINFAWKTSILNFCGRLEVIEFSSGKYLRGKKFFLFLKIYAYFLFGKFHFISSKNSKSVVTALRQRNLIKGCQFNIERNKIKNINLKDFSWRNGNPIGREIQNVISCRHRKVSEKRKFRKVAA